MGSCFRRNDLTVNVKPPVLLPSHRRPYIQPQPPCGTPHMAGSFLLLSVQGCLPNPRSPSIAREIKKSTPVVNPATEEPMYEVALGSKADVDKAVAAARRAFETYSQTSREERVALLSKIVEVYKTRMKDIGAAVSDEMGAPLP